MIGRELGQYKILAEIGRGGMGIVYKAYQTSLNREVALKVLPAQLSVDENLVKRFHREAEAAARLSHPNIVQIFDINEIEGIHFFAMEYLKGETLTQKMEREGALSIREAVRIASLVTEALSYSHSEGIVHRDIKPGNIMIDSHGHVKVTDFGLARAMESSRLTMTGIIVGTPEYMSPEQARGDPLDGRADLYSIGLVLYELLTGQLPFEASTPFAMAQKQIYEPIPSLRLIRPEIPLTLEEVILKATQKNPQNRYQRGEDFKSDLEIFLSGKDLERITPTVAVPPAALPLKVREGFLRKLRWGRVALFFFLMMGLISFLSRIKRPSPKVEEPPSREEEKTVAPLTPEVAEDEAQAMIEEARRLMKDGAYGEAMAKLTEIQEKFPDHPQAKLIPLWIKEAQDKEAKERFHEAAKEYLEAQALEKERKVIEAAQLYQSIITRYPGSTWQEKAEEAIARLKERETRLKEKGLIREEKLREERPRQEKVSFDREIEELVRQDKQIMHFMIDEDREGLTQYLLESYADKIEGWSKEVGITPEAFASEFSQRLIMGMKKELGEGKKEPGSRPEGQPRQFKPPQLEEAEKAIKEMKAGDPNIEKLIERGEEIKLGEYLWLRHEPDLKKIALAMKLPAGRIGRPFAYKTARYLIRPEEGLIKMEPGKRKDFRPPPEGRFLDRFRQLSGEDETLAQYVERGEVEGLSNYLMSQYDEELQEMSREVDRPLEDMAWELAERLVHEQEKRR